MVSEFNDANTFAQQNLKSNRQLLKISVTLNAECYLPHDSLRTHTHEHDFVTEHTNNDDRTCDN